MAHVDHYRVLGVQKNATDKQIRKAYISLALKYHPDKNKRRGAQERFQEIQRAYEVLSDRTLRREYDSSRYNPQREQGTSRDHGTHHTYDNYNDQAPPGNLSDQINNLLDAVSSPFFGVTLGSFGVSINGVLNSIDPMMSNIDVVLGNHEPGLYNGGRTYHYHFTTRRNASSQGNRNSGNASSSQSSASASSNTNRQNVSNQTHRRSTNQNPSRQSRNSTQDASAKPSNTNRSKTRKN